VTDKIETLDQLLEFYDQWDNLADRAVDIAIAIAKFNQWDHRNICSDNIKIDASDIYCEWYDCDSDEDRHIWVRDDYFFDNAYMRKIAKETEQRERMDAIRKEVERKKREESREEQDYAQYIKLRAKYEPLGPFIA